MSKEVISTTNAPAAIGPYSQGISTDNLIFISGQVPINPEAGKILSEDIENQARQSLDNLKSILEAAGSDMSKIVKTTVLLTDFSDFAKVNEIYAQYFQEPYPARACFQVSKLPAEAKIEIEAIATK